MESVRHGCVGAAQCAGIITVLRCLLARRPVPPNRLALALGAFVGSFRTVESLARVLLQRPNSRLAALVAAAVAFLIFEKHRQATFVSYATMEAITVLAKQSDSLAQTPFIEIYVGVVAFGRIIYTWIYAPHLFLPSHLALLDKLSGLPALTLQRMRTELPTKTATSRCDVFHRGQSCAQFHTRFILDGFKRAMKIYVPIYLIYSGALKYRQWIWGPRPSLPNVVIQYLRTCACLTLSYEIGALSACVLPFKSHRLVTLLGGMFTTVCLLAETAKRRTSVLKAVSVYSVYTTGVWLENKYKLPTKWSKLLQLWLFALATMTILRRPDQQNRRLMQFLYGYKLPKAPTDKQHKCSIHEPQQTTDQEDKQEVHSPEDDESDGLGTSGEFVKVDGSSLEKTEL